MTTEHDVRAALHGAAEDAAPGSPPAWQDITRRAERAGRRKAVLATTFAAVALVAAGLAGAVAVGRDDGGGIDQVVAGPVTSTATTDVTGVPTTTSLLTTTTGVAEPDHAADEGIWPFTSRAEAEAYEPRQGADYSDPQRTALEFAVEYLGMVTAIADFDGNVQKSNPARAVVRVRPNPRSSLVTELRLLQVTDDAWTVTGAQASSIDVTSPVTDELVSSPISLEGQAAAYEGTVQVDVRAEKQKIGDRIGRTFVTGNGGPEKGPFSGSVEFAPGPVAEGAIVFYESSAEDGSTIAATVVRIRMQPPLPPCEVPQSSPTTVPCRG